MPRDSSDNSKVESLVKILRREQETGFEDSAVIGGLDRFLQQAEEELAPVLGPIKSYTPPSHKNSGRGGPPPLSGGWRRPPQT